MITIERIVNINGSEADDYSFKGLSTDTKPIENIAVNSLFLELDTGDFYFFDGYGWEKVGG